MCKKQYEKVTSERYINKFKDDVLFAVLAEENQNGFANISKAIQIQNLLCCSDCNQILRDPRVLSCFSIICAICLEKRKSLEKQEPSAFHCTKCEKGNKHLNKEYNNFKVDFEIKSIVDIILPLMETSEKCKVHDKQDLNLVCLSGTCNFAICKDCFNTCHREHDVKTLFQIFYSSSYKIHENVSAFQENIEEQITQLKQANSRKDDLKKQIEGAINGLQSALLTIQSQLFLQVDSLKDAADESVKEQVDFLIEKRDELKMELSNAIGQSSISNILLRLLKKSNRI